MSDSFELGEVEVASTPLERFKEFLQSRGMRLTQQQRVLVEEIFSRHDHFDAEELLAQLRSSRGGARVSRPTVYRSLEKLVEAGLLRKMSLDGRAVYEHDYGYPQHDHLYCQQCNRLIEFNSDEIVRFRDEVARQHQFRVASHRLIITGTCADCSRRNKRRTRPLDLI